MGNLVYYIVDSDGKIVHSGLELILTLHEFIQGLQFEKLEIKPAMGSGTIKIPTTGALNVSEPPLIDVNADLLKIMTVDGNVYKVYVFVKDRWLENGN